MKIKLLLVAITIGQILIIIVTNKMAWAQQPLGKAGKGEQGCSPHYIEVPAVKYGDTYYRMNYCLNRDGHCGQEAADNFCKHIGYQSVEGFEMGNCGGAASFWVSDKRVCTGPNCICFSYIECCD